MECPECSGQLYLSEVTTKLIEIDSIGVDGNLELGEVLDEFTEDDDTPKIQCDGCEATWTPTELAGELFDEVYQDDRLV